MHATHLPRDPLAAPPPETAAHIRARVGSENGAATQSCLTVLAFLGPLLDERGWWRGRR